MKRPRIAIFLTVLAFLHTGSPAHADDEALALITRCGGEINLGKLAPGLVELTSSPMRRAAAAVLLLRPSYFTQLSGYLPSR